MLMRCRPGTVLPQEGKVAGEGRAKGKSDQCFLSSWWRTEEEITLLRDGTLEWGCRLGPGPWPQASLVSHRHDNPVKLAPGAYITAKVP